MATAKDLAMIVVPVLAKQNVLHPAVMDVDKDVPTVVKAIVIICA
jgi:hypothetical protein